VALDPTLQVVAVVGGENFASGQTVSKMCHSSYLSFLYTHIIPHFPVFVKYFCEKKLKIFSPGHDPGGSGVSCLTPQSRQ
jgi:hypothetical protein